MAREPGDLLPLPPATFNVLLAVGGRELHGYAIMSEVERLSDGAIRMGTRTLYGTVKPMVETGLLVQSGRTDLGDDERRRYYRLSDFGRRVLDAETRRLQAMMRRAGALRPGLGTA